MTPIRVSLQGSAEKGSACIVWSLFVESKCAKNVTLAHDVKHNVINLLRVRLSLQGPSEKGSASFGP